MITLLSPRTIAPRDALNRCWRVVQLPCRICEPLTPPMRFPPGNFTLFSPTLRCAVSSFPHGTCSLSVSCPYSALDGAYHPCWDCIPKQPDSESPQLVARRGVLPLAWSTGLSPSVARGFPPPLRPPRAGLIRCALHKPHPSHGPRESDAPSTAAAGSRFGLVPLHSQLLRESLLVSFPPPNDMLKSSG